MSTMSTPITATLTEIEPGKYEVSGVGTPYFWPHDGDIVTSKEIQWIEKKGWKIETIPLDKGKDE